MINEVQEILINESEIQEKVKYLAEQINKDYAGKDIVLMIILKGSVVFSADLMRYLNVNVRLTLCRFQATEVRLFPVN